MLFLEILGETDLTTKNFLSDALRGAFSFLDRSFYNLLTILYKLFFNISTWDVFGEAFFKFFGRVQIIIGVYMIFQLALTILKGILDPESFGKNTTGAKGLVPRILTSLVLLVVLLPVNIGGSGGSSEFRDRIANQGLLFGTLSSLQYRILTNNTVGKLILGTNDDNGFTASSSDASSGDDELDVSSRMFVSTILRGFYRINLIPEEDRVHEEGKTDDMLNDNRVCKNISADVLNKYTRLDAYPNDIINTIDETCPTSNNIMANVFKIQKGDFYYAFNYFLPFISTIVGIILCVIMLSFSYDVAVRAIKLGLLRLIAPIPIISHMDPNGSKDEALNAWSKTLVSTYLDLFVRLASVYFAIFLIQDMIVEGIVIEYADGILGILSYIIIIIGLFGFAKQVPKFIREVLGLKGDGGNIFSGFGMIAGAAVGTAGILGSARTNWRAASDEGKALYGGENGDQKKLLRALRTGASAIGGGFGGAFVAGKALVGKDANPAAVMKAQSARNATRASHSTLPGRVTDNVYSMFTGRSLADKASKTLEANKEAFSSLKNWKSSVKAEAAKNGGAFDFTLSDGTVLNGITYDQIEAAKAAGANDEGKYTVTSGNGTVKIAADLLGANTMDAIADEQVRQWQGDNRRVKGTDANGNPILADSWKDTISTGKLAPDHARTVKAVNDADISVDGLTGAALVNNYGKLGSAMGEANRNQQTQETDMRQQMRIANKRENK